MIFFSKASTTFYKLRIFSFRDSTFSLMVPTNCVYTAQFRYLYTGFIVRVDIKTLPCIKQQFIVIYRFTAA